MFDFKAFYWKLFLDSWQIWVGIAVLIAISNVISNFKPSKNKSKKKPASKEPKSKNRTLTGNYKKATFLTSNEKIAFGIIKDTLPRDYNVSCKVRMLDVVEPINNDFGFQEKIIKKHFDFVITDSFDKIVLIIELDDKSHNSDSAKERDGVKNEILNDVGIPLWRTWSIDSSELRIKLGLQTTSTASTYRPSTSYRTSSYGSARR